MPVPLAARSKAWVCGRSPAEIVGSNPTGSIDVYLLWLVCFQVELNTRPVEAMARWGAVTPKEIK